MARQHTISTSVSLEGIGLHTGEPAKITLNPAPENYGIRFVRTDIDKRVEIQADIDNVVDLEWKTAIGKDGVNIYSMEHLMAAFAGLEIDNCLVEVHSSEIPLMDGSALPYVNLVKEAGIIEQSAEREFLTIEEPLTYVEGEQALGVFPCDHFRLTCAIDYKHPALGAQYTTMFSLKEFVDDFAPARTFTFLSWIEKLREQGHIKGGTLSSALMVQDIDITQEHVEYMLRLFNEKGPIKPGKNGFVNNVKLRFYNEPCRHKALDIIGDLYLLGKPLKAHILASRPGHEANHRMAKEIRQSIARSKRAKTGEIKKALNHSDILDILPHRYPFLLIDSVLDIEPNKSIVATKNISFSDPFFQGHFPGDPIMPGVLQVEAMAQAGGIMGLYGQKLGKDKAIAFLGIDRARFRNPVRPGDLLRIEVELLQNRRGTIRFAGKCTVDGKVTCEAELMAMLTKR
ncbi:MAG: bifunctional UDP-3-O-[3-hydroxymyristoyl] N-acetylglucosamine deacetylase/3-hydroxyacyl-ACP dehydratase [Chitinivibrionales bacterium]|nr:bifunctional UDP-3-O-[3-hydroxymyristoyl] N-acetylglucosamine deacetylase/3-hydroxyacyl-ACP dehydratase [Chitinivibrionales bacterium]